MSYFGYFQQSIVEFVAPWFLRQKNIATFLEAFGLVADGEVDGFIQGMRLANPLRCDVSAFPALSKDRKIRLYPTEPEASKRRRLSIWRQLRRHAGSHYGEMLNLQPYFLPGAAPTIRIVHQSGNPGTGAIATWHTMAPDGTYSVYRPPSTNWNFDNVPAKWSRFWVVLYMPPGTNDGVAYDDGVTVYDDGHTVYDGNFTAAQYADLIAIINEFKAAHSIMWGFIVTSDPTMFDPTGTGDGVNLPAGNWGFTVDPFGNLTRPVGATWIFDLGQG